MADFDNMSEPKKKDETVVAKVMKNGGGAVSGGLIGGMIAAPLLVWTVGAVLAPWTGGVSLAAAAALTAAAAVGGAVVGHKASQGVD